MKNLSLLFLLLFPFLLFAQNEPVGFVCRQGLTDLQAPPYGEENPLTAGYNMKYMRYELSINPAVYNIAGKITYLFEAVENNLDHIYLDLSTALTVDKVEYHGLSLNFEQSAGDILVIELPSPLAAGVLDSMAITYHGAPPPTGFGSFVQSQHSGSPIIWTLSEPFGASDWQPCKNGLTDKVDSIDLIIATPIGFRAAANGILVSEEEVDGEMVYFWKHRHPIAAYLIAFAVANYQVYSDLINLSDGTQMEMLNYVYPESINTASSGTANHVQVIEFYDSLFVKYPFANEKYGHAQFGWGGGMEHQTMSFVVNFSWSLLAHETGHQWFGDMVTCGSWEDIWLNEGWAGYMEGLTYERFNSGNWSNWRTSNLNNIVSQPGGSVQVDDTTSVNRIFSSRLTYSKGAYLLHMLRWKLGDEVFFQSARNYLNQFAYSFAKTPDFQNRLEEDSGENLDEFFADWYYGQGYPSYDILWQQDGDDLYLKISQTSSHSSVSFFEMPLPIRISDISGNAQMLRLEHTENDQVFKVEVPFKVFQVQFDPGLWLISKDNTVKKGTVVADNETRAAEEFRLYPNPVGDKLFLATQGNLSSSPLHWTLSDLNGRPLRSGHFNGLESLEISMENLAAGQYLLSLRSDGQLSKVFQVVKR